MRDDAKSGDPRTVQLHISMPHACPYLPERDSTNLFAETAQLSPAAYEKWMNAGFRRSGTLIYKPICEKCAECRPLRVPVNAFQLSRSQRRVWRRNQDVSVAIGAPEPTDEKWQVYAAYLTHQHNGKMDHEREDFERFLYESPTSTLEMTFRVAEELLGVGLVDECPSCLSSVYFYFAPQAAKRSLGVFSALCEIEECRRRGLAYWYAGYYIRDCRQMNYKAQYRPYELLGSDSVWRPAESADTNRQSVDE